MPDLPFGFDRADGLLGRLGTPSKPDQIVASSAAGYGPVEALPIEEESDSPEIERAEQATISHRFRMSWSEAYTRILGLSRGLVRVDEVGNAFKLLSAKVQFQKPGIGILSTVEEGMSFDSPPDQFEVCPVELGLNIMKHPRYFYAFLGEGMGSATEWKNQMVIRFLQDYMETTNAAFRNAILWMLYRSLGHDDGAGTYQPPLPQKGQTDGIGPAAYWPAGSYLRGTDMAKRAAMEIVQKYWRGEETPSVVGWQLTWSQFYFYPQPLNPGGYVENPMTQALPQLPEYFWSSRFPPDPRYSIFDYMAQANPQCYSSDGTSAGSVNISWRREADRITYERTWFKIQRSWLGAPVGHWDEDLYTRGPRPSATTDYRWLA